MLAGLLQVDGQGNLGWRKRLDEMTDWYYPACLSGCDEREMLARAIVICGH
jgi:hypothetical protein